MMFNEFLGCHLMLRCTNGIALEDIKTKIK